MEDEHKIKISGLWDTLKRYDAYIATVNFKSGLITSLNLAIFGGVLLKANELILQNLNIKLLISLILFLISLLSIASVIWVVKSISPKLASKDNEITNKSSIIFFGSVASNYTSDSYAEKFKSYTIEEFERDLLNQVHEVASITNTKFKLIKIAGDLTKLNLLTLCIFSVLIIINSLGVTLCLR